MTRAGELQATRTADTEVFYMAGRQLAALGRRLREAGWPADTPVSVVSRAGWPDQIGSDHTAGTLAQAALLHSGRPTVVTVGVGAEAVVPAGLTAAATLPQAEAPEPLQVRPVPSAAAAEHMAERMAERIAEPTLMAP
jgi:uroporphyrin-III C-methyltransferase